MAERSTARCARLATLACLVITAPASSTTHAEEPDEVSQEALTKARQDLDEARARLDVAQAKVAAATNTPPPGMREPTAEEKDDFSTPSTTRPTSSNPGTTISDDPAITETEGISQAGMTTLGFAALV